ncbi:MAG: DNA repair protein RecN [Ignavibacteriaceae bacterium]
MLKSLLVRDYALIEAVEIEFDYGLNIITGETGAGKSILIDAMSLLLGERASTEVVRKGAVRSVVEGVFEVEKNKKIKNFLEENDLEFLPDLIVRREISLKGANRCFINDTPVTLNLVKDIGNLLVDLHGQHEHQSLLRTETHIEFLDEFGTSPDLLNKYKTCYSELSELILYLNDLRSKESVLKEKKDLYSFQLKEIDAVSPGEREEESLVKDLNILENSEKLLSLTSGIYQSLYEAESSVYDSLVKIKNQLSELVSIDRAFSESSNECESAVALIKDISDFIRSYNSKIDLDPGKLEEVRERLGAISLLKRKYGGTVKSIIDYRQKIGEEYELAENYSGSIKEIEHKIKSAREECGRAAVELTKVRKSSARKVEKEVQSALKNLGIENAVFKADIRQKPADNNPEHFIIADGKPYNYNHSGIDEVEFYVSTNKGEDPKPLAKVASGGEISRIMLALKETLAKNDKLPLLIFDEIDTGVSGRVAQKVGHALKSLAAYHQIIAITHLPQISGLADHHFMVEKKNIEGRVVSSIKRLNNEERIIEVAKLMSGENITEASLKGAKELMGL